MLPVEINVATRTLSISSRFSFGGFHRMSLFFLYYKVYFSDTQLSKQRLNERHASAIRSRERCCDYVVLFGNCFGKIDGKKTKMVESYLGNGNLKNHFVSFVESLEVSGISFLIAEPQADY